MTARRLGPVARRMARLPSRLYDWRLGWLLGHRFLRLTHVGRRSGRRYRTVLEVVGHAEPGEVVVVGRVSTSAGQSGLGPVSARSRPRQSNGFRSSG